MPDRKSVVRPKETKKSHFVPQAYLRFFHASDDPDRIWEFDKTQLQARKKRIPEVAQQRYFYREQRADGSFDNSLEAAFQEFEGKTPGVLQALLNALKEKSRIDVVQPELAEQMAMLFFRTKSMRESIENVLQDEGKKILEVVPDADMSKIHTYDHRQYHIDFLKDNAPAPFWVWLELLTYFEWAPFFYPEGGIITSDNPISVLGMGNVFRCEIPNNQKEIETAFLFPVSPNYLLLALAPDYCEYCGVNSTGRVTQRGELWEYLRTSNQINHCTTSSRSLFSSREDFTGIREFFAENPETRYSSQE